MAAMPVNVAIQTQRVQVLRVPTVRRMRPNPVQPYALRPRVNLPIVVWQNVQRWWRVRFRNLWMLQKAIVLPMRVGM